MILGFFGATDESLTGSDYAVCEGEISIQRQGMFAFGDPLPSALSEYVDIPQQEMRARVTGHGRQGLGQLRFRRRE
jgi:hypothetical protein